MFSHHFSSQYSEKKTTFPCLFFFFFLLLSSLFQPFSRYSPPFLPFILIFIHYHILFTHIHHFHFSISFISSFHFFFTNYHLFFSSFFFSHHLYYFFLFFFYLLSTTFSPFLPSTFPFHLLFTKYPWGTVQLFIFIFFLGNSTQYFCRTTCTRILPVCFALWLFFFDIVFPSCYDHLFPCCVSFLATVLQIYQRWRHFPYVKN